MKQVLMEGRDICKTFAGNGSHTPVLQSVNVDIYKDDFTIIMGASGAGKSTLLYALSGMDKITGGNVTYRGIKLTGLSENQMAGLRAKEFGFVFQQTHLVSNLTLFENVAVAGYVGKPGTPKEVREKAENLLRQMGVGSARDRLPCHVSGGEAQRAAIARAMINRPSLIFADEPTGALNRAHTGEVLDLLSALNKNRQSILMVTHDLRAAIRGNRLLYLEDGKILDELSLPSYDASSAKVREATVSRWLSSLAW